MLWRVSIIVGGRPLQSRTNNLFQELILVWMWMMDFLGTISSNSAKLAILSLDKETPRGLVVNFIPNRRTSKKAVYQMYIHYYCPI